MTQREKSPRKKSTIPITRNTRKTDLQMKGPNRRSKKRRVLRVDVIEYKVGFR